MMAVDALEVALRVVAALSLTSAAILLAHGLWRGLLRPHQAWLYAFIVTLLVAAWRWFIVWLAVPAHSDEAIAVAPWVQQINQTVYALIGVTLAVLAIVGSRRRAGDG
jgi:hypothetical protein